MHGSAADISLSGFPGSTDVCGIVGAELERMVELTGAANVQSTHPTCRCTGGASCDYELSWTR